MIGRKFLFSLILAAAMVALLFFSGCISQSCSSDKGCKAWQACDPVKRQCALKEGHCSLAADCNDTMKTCDADHLCSYIDGKCRNDVDCGSWRVCDVEGNNTCRPKAGFCDSDTFCDLENEVCSGTLHKCVPKPGKCRDQFDCEAFQVCNVAGGECVSLPGRCTLDAECERWQACNATSKYCNVRPGFCNNDLNCENWTVCDSLLHRCMTSGDSCLEDKDCSDWQLCNPKTKKCEAKRGLCSSLADCESFQVCDVESRRCITRTGYCSSNSECNSKYQMCNEKTHKCETMAGYCTQSGQCAYDEICQTDPLSVNAYKCVKVTCQSNDDCPGSTCDVTQSPPKCRKIL